MSLQMLPFNQILEVILLSPLFPGFVSTFPFLLLVVGGRSVLLVLLSRGTLCLLSCTAVQTW